MMFCRCNEKAINCEYVIYWTITSSHSEDSDQSGHSPSLIKVFICTLWTPKSLSVRNSDSDFSDQNSLK